MLTLESLTKTYRTGDRALAGVSFTISEGQVVAIIGPSGAGKSTLLRCINRLVEPTSGHVLLDGVDLTSLRGSELRRSRRHIGMIFQEHALIERLTVMENVLSGRLGYMPVLRSLLRRYPSAMVEQALMFLEEVGLTTQAEKRADELSGGQRQRVGIARALMQEPRILLVDEPTASLDPKTARQVMRLITGIASTHGLPAVVNLHDVGLARLFAARIIGLRQGAVVFDGTPDRLTNDALTGIYGEEDWAAGARRSRDDHQGETHPEHVGDLLLAQAGHPHD